MTQDEQYILIKKYCLVQKTTTWHLLCVGGVLQCLECYLLDRIAENLGRYEEELAKLQ